MSFDALKSLAGTWTGPVTTDPPDPDIDGPIQVTMRVASRGNVLVHEIAPGGVPEPTMIYLEDNRLTGKRSPVTSLALVVGSAAD